MYFKRQSLSYGDQAGDRMPKIQGIVHKKTFANPETGWGVFRLEIHVPGESHHSVTAKNSITIVGPLAQLQEGESVEVSGVWADHPKFGKQFKVETITLLEPLTLQGLRKYMGSGILDGIGPVLADRMVDAWGDNTFTILDTTPDRAAEIPGIGKEKVESIKAAWQTFRANREILVWLYGLGLGPLTAQKVLDKYAKHTIESIQQNPYILADDIEGIGFKLSDSVAHKMGIPADSLFRIEAALRYVMSMGIDDGHTYLPRDDLISNASDLLGLPRDKVEMVLSQNTPTGIYLDGENYYLESMYHMEKRLAEWLIRRSMHAAPINIDAYLKPRENVVLDPEQIMALQAAFQLGVSIITGPPGVGKTFIISEVCRIAEELDMKIGLCAPTGRAAKRMAELTGCPASTIHRLLGFDPHTQKFFYDGETEEKTLPFDIVVVDEMSMCDLRLSYALFKAMSEDTKVLLVGDVDQLPPVGAGAVFRDAIVSGAVPTTRLTTVHRQARGSLIIVNAHRINKGIMPRNEYPGAIKDFWLFQVEDSEEIVKEVVNLVTNQIPGAIAVNPMTDIQVIAPLKRGVLGVDNLNSRLQAAVNPRFFAIGSPRIDRGSRAFVLGDRVMQIRNSYAKGVFNGEQGFIVDVDPDAKTMKVDFLDERVIDYKADEIGDLVLSYACTVHKSQGMEFPAVVIVLHSQHYIMLQRKLLYTAITRGKQMVVVIGTNQAMGIAVKNDEESLRYSALAQRIVDGKELEEHARH